MTEDEAKVKWCPFFRVSAGHQSYTRTNRDRVGEEPAKCIASACMAWRWRDGTPRDPWLADVERAGGLTHDSDGFCGLAGTPA